MSDFPGIVSEIPGLSIDRFDENNYDSTVYLLSHCHFDHMKGIDDPGFLNNLFNRPEVFIYMSEVSAQILKGLRPNLSPKVKHLPMHTPNLIKVPYFGDNLISVTLIPAGHCPGSVMFLLENDKVILYTGDFRVRPSDLKKYTAFYTFGEVKKIHKVYLDTTFFDKNYSMFPSREEVLNDLTSIINEWLERNENNVIFLNTSAHVGYENVYIELYKRLKIPIHVCRAAYDFYKHIPEMDEAITLDEGVRIHSCRDSNPDKYQAMCRSCTAKIFNRRTIKLSAQRWTENSFKCGHSSKSGDYFYLCYSTHASYKEIKDFMLFLKPDEIEICVGRSQEKLKEIRMLLDDIIGSYKSVDKREERTVNKYLMNRNPLKYKPKQEVKGSVKCEIMELLESSPPLKKRK